MASSRFSSVLQEEVDMAVKINQLEARTSNLETEFSNLFQTARQLLIATRRYVEKMEIENQSWDLMENIMESENNSRQILDYLKIFFNFLLGRLQRHGADIVDIFMLWTLLDTEGVNRLFLDGIAGFGFKSNDVHNIKLLLAVVCKDHRERIEGNPSDDDDEIIEKTKENKKKYTKEVQGNAKNDTIADLTHIALDAGKNAEIATPEIPLHDHCVEDLLKTWEANEGINIFGMDEDLKSVLKRMIAVVIFTLNIGKDKVSGLYDIGKTTENDNNNAVEDENKDGIPVSQINDSDRDLISQDDEARNTNIMMDNGHRSIADTKENAGNADIFKDHNNSALINDSILDAPIKMNVPSLKSIILENLARDAGMVTTMVKKAVAMTSITGSQSTKEDNKKNDEESDDENSKTEIEMELDICSCSSNEALDEKLLCDDVMAEDVEIDLLEQNVCLDDSEDDDDDVLAELEAFLLG